MSPEKRRKVLGSLTCVCTWNSTFFFVWTYTARTLPALFCSSGKGRPALEDPKVVASWAT